MKRIFMVFEHEPFGDAVEGLLRQRSDLEIVGRGCDPEEAIARIRELRPDVIILDNDDPAGQLSSLVARILGDRMGVRVIGLNLQDNANNTICTYHGEQRIVHEAQDLVEIIESQDYSIGLAATDSRAVPLMGERREGVRDRDGAVVPAGGHGMIAGHLKKWAKISCRTGRKIAECFVERLERFARLRCWLWMGKEGGKIIEEIEPV